MVTGSRTGGSPPTAIDEKTRKMIRSMKEIVGNHTDADILTALKEDNMDADMAVQKLMNQDPFHEVKRKKDKKKEDPIIVEPADRRKPSENVSREVNFRPQPEHNFIVRRGGYNQNHFSRNAAPRNVFPKNPATGPSREFRVVRDNRSNLNADKELKHTSAQSSRSNISEEVAVRNIKSSSGDQDVAQRRSGQTGNVPLHRPTRKELNGGRQIVHDVTVPSSNSVLGVYSSSADPVHVPSPDSRSSAVGTIRREVRGVGFGGKPSENVAKDSPAAGSLVESAITRDVPKAYRPFSPVSKIDQGSQTNARESAMPNHRSLSNSRYQHVKTQHQAGGHPRGVSQNKQWKPKSNQKSNNPGVIGTPKKSRAPPTDKSVNLESEIVKPQDTHLHVSISESQNVIIADDIRVPKTDRYQLSFGSFVMDFDPSKNSESGFEEACSSQELKRGDINDSLPIPPLKASTNGASDTKTGESFDSEVRNSRAGSPPPVLMASEQQLSEQKDAPGSQSLDEYAQIEFISGNSPPYTALEPKQQQDPLELHNFSQDYDPRGGYDLPYFRQPMDENMRGQGLPSPQEQALNPHMFNNAPSSTIPMLQQQQVPMAQMYPQVVSHYPNGMPYRQFLSPIYVPQMPMQGYTGNPAQYAHPSNGNSYVLMPGGSSHPGANGLKYGIQQFKPVPTGGPTGFSTFNNPNGYQVSSLNVVGNAPGFEDSSRMKYKDGNVYVPNPQAETSEIWMQNSRDLQSPPYYNMAGQTPHAAYLSSFNSPPVQSSHMQFQGVFHSPQPGPMAVNPHHMGPGLGGGNVGLGVAPSPSPVQVGAYQQQPQLGHLNWPSNF
uniref:GBF-interacting protein 1 N-terminal domain-containing protein n=1 Tax=Noccaea caerulescens TaxID=107243 RepID=A0A1J3I8R8_NOCCA